MSTYYLRQLVFGNLKLTSQYRRIYYPLQTKCDCYTRGLVTLAYKTNVLIQETNLRDASRQTCPYSSLQVPHHHPSLINLHNLYTPNDGHIQRIIKRFAGHSKWANIRHTKAAKDGAKAQIASKIGQKIRIAIREGGGPNPQFNFQLARVLEQASNADIPKSTIDNVIKKEIKANEDGSVARYEGKGPGGCALIVEAFTSTAKKVQADINTCFRKNGGHNAEKIIAAFFDEKGVIMVRPSGTLKTFEEIEEAAILAEAEEVLEEPDEDGTITFKVICDAGTVYNVRKQLTKDHQESNIENAVFQYIPKDYGMVSLSGEMLEAAMKLVDAIENIPDVERVYTNIDVIDKS